MIDMAILDFPSVDTADESGLVAVGGDLEVSSLKLAYRRGIFPWPISREFPLAWFSPDPRGVLDYKDLIVSTSLKKALKRGQFEVRFNTCFMDVIEACACIKNRKNESETWITPEIIQGYINFHNAGHAYSVETINKETGELVGGLYGVLVGGHVSGESMFYRESNASKIALYRLMERLSDYGINYLDTQMVTPIVEAFGGKEISRDNFLKRISEEKKINFFEIFS
ncbi:MAG: leucyl/phenylalanyl-tRNA--protein transferase [Halobacteriovorax sp.]|nr:leucyl/phenylalanyl-tRNA--protein transferase [Halobacteriovorax sp.]